MNNAINIARSHSQAIKARLRELIYSVYGSVRNGQGAFKRLKCRNDLSFVGVEAVGTDFPLYVLPRFPTLWVPCSPRLAVRIWDTG